MITSLSMLFGRKSLFTVYLQARGTRLQQKNEPGRTEDTKAQLVFRAFSPNDKIFFHYRLIPLLLQRKSDIFPEFRENNQIFRDALHDFNKNWTTLKKATKPFGRMVHLPAENQTSFWFFHRKTFFFFGQPFH
ncbi:hypothetical protein WMO24_04285 [Ruthenibacterium sp. CLA-JM-H11]|uniref:Transposase n=2 Tax=Ruthenibacterium intestinale TaxID=3133163 RepID=A0ABV1GCU6_9FIRM